MQFKISLKLMMSIQMDSTSNSFGSATSGVGENFFIGSRKPKPAKGNREGKMKVTKKLLQQLDKAVVQGYDGVSVTTKTHYHTWYGHRVSIERIRQAQLGEDITRLGYWQTATGARARVTIDDDCNNMIGYIALYQL